METDSAAAGPGEAILVIRLSSLGDVLLTAPAMRALRERFPGAHIDFLVASEFEPAARMVAGFDRILTFNRRRGFAELRAFQKKYFRCYDIVVDLQNSFRSALLRTFLFPTIWVKAQRYRIRRWFAIHLKWDLYRQRPPVTARYLRAVEMLGAKSDDLALQLQLPDADGADAERLPKRLAFCPGAKHFTKRWPAERWIELGRELRRQQFELLVIGTETERDLITSISEGIGDTETMIGADLQEVARELHRSKLAITNDSGLMHLAYGVGTPVAAIFGPTVEHFGFYPDPNLSSVIDNELHCRPCSAFGGARCPKGHFKCMLDTTPQRVLQTVEALLAESE